MLRIAMLGAFVSWSVVAAPTAQISTPDPDIYKNIAWRSIGPCNMGGRITDVEGVPGKPYILYVGTASGGLWKTVNGAISSEPLFDEQPVHAIGDVALDPANAEVIWVGTGEDNPRNTVSYGNGVYKSPDGGKTWLHMGLEDTRHISRVVVHPRNPDIVYVAAIGHAFGPNEQRGVFMTTDGGSNWEKVLYVDEETGASDLEMDPANPNILYAGMWTFMRKPWTMRSGSEKGGLYKSVDGGRTWKELTVGLPALMGRIGVKAARSNPKIVYVMAETKEGKLFHSEDHGETFETVYEKWDILSRGFYFAELRIDPANENRIYAISGALRVTDDGGKTWKSIGGKLHSDHHALWIDPENPNVLVDGNDGGVGISRDRGALWEYVQNVPMGQYYQIDVDHQVPFYMIYGGLQDNGSWGLPARSRHRFGISNAELISIGGGDGFFAAVHPEKPDQILSDSQGGNIVRFDKRTGQSQRISPYPANIIGGAPASEHEFRFDWNAPIVISHHDPDTVYFGGNVLFRSSDFGTSWDVISPDLTTNDAEKLQSSGGPIRPDNTTAEYHCVILGISESPLTPGFVWVGTDDSQVQVTRDGGETWDNVSANISGLPEASLISHVEASRSSEASAYVAAELHQLDDFRPYIFKTDDYGKSWTNISGDLPSNAYVHVLREDPKNPNVLYAGTESGVFVSMAGGGEWFQLRMKNLPAALAVHDIIVHPEENDLILGTHGRSIWVLDDVGFLQQMTPEVLESDVHLFETRKAWRYSFWTGDTGGTVWGGDKSFWGPNPDYGALITYSLKEESEEEADVEIEILDDAGEVIRKVEGTKEKGLNRVAWDLRYEGPEQRKAESEEDRQESRRRTRGPQVVPGEYTIRLKVGEATTEGSVQVALESALSVSPADLELQLETALDLRDRISSLNLELRALDSIESQIKSIQKLAKDHVPDEVKERLDALLEKIDTQRTSMVRDPEGGYTSSTRILGKLTGWLSGITRTEAAPTRHQREYIETLRAEVQESLDSSRAIVGDDVASLNEILRAHGLPIVYVGRDRGEVQ